MEFELIKNALIEYDKNQPDIINFLNNVEYIKGIKNPDANTQYIFYNNKDEIILKSNIEQMGVYSCYNNILKWAWSDPYITNNLYSREILNYAFNLNNKHDIFLKTELINSAISITNNFQLEIYTAILCFITKKKLIIPISIFDDKEINNQIFLKQDDITIIQYRKLQENNITFLNNIFKINFIYILDFE